MTAGRVPFPAARFWPRVVAGPNCCWIWTGATTVKGYGQISIENRNRRTHRVAYEHFVGPIADGLTIDHLCRNVACCNPDHLEAVTVRENTMRGEGLTARHARKESCDAGHSLTDPANTYIRVRNGRLPSRECRACKIERVNARRAALRGERNV